MIFLLLFILLLPFRVEAAIAVVQSVGVQANGANSVTTADITTASANLIVCDGGAYVAASSVDVTDSKSNTYTRPIYIGSAFDGFMQGGQWYKENATGGASHNFTLTFDANGDLVLACKEVSGALTSGALDRTASKEDNGTSQTSGLSSNATATTSQNDELFAGAGIFGRYSGDTVPTAQSGFTANQSLTATTSLSMGMVSASKIVSTTSAAEFTYDISVASDGGSPAWIGTYKATVAASTAARRRIINNP